MALSPPFPLRIFKILLAYVRMKVIRNYVSSSGLKRPNGDAAQTGDTVRLYLDIVANPTFPETVEAQIVYNITKTKCCGFSYSFEYDYSEIIRVCDILDVEVLDCCAILDETKANKDSSNISNIPSWKQKLGIGSQRLIKVSRRSPLILGNSLPVNQITYDTLLSGELGNLVSGKIFIEEAGWYDISAFSSFQFSNTSLRTSLTVRNEGYLISRNICSEEQSLYVVPTNPLSVVAYPTLTASGKCFIGRNELISVNFFQTSGSNQEIDSTNYDRLSTLTINRLDNFNVPFTRKIVGCGDSIMAGTVCGPENSVIKFLSADTINFGVSGAKTTDLLLLSNTIKAEGGQDVDLVINIGINDCGTNPSPNISQIADNIITFFEDVKSSFRRVVWITAPPDSESTHLSINPNVEVSRQQLNAEMVSRDYAGLLIARTDLDPLIGPSGRENVLDYNYDKLHATPLGEFQMSKSVVPLLQ